MATDPDICSYLYSAYGAQTCVHLGTNGTGSALNDWFVLPFFFPHPLLSIVFHYKWPGISYGIQGLFSIAFTLSPLFLVPLFFFFLVSMQYLAARIFGGKGRFLQQSYAFALINTPYYLISLLALLLPVAGELIIFVLPFYYIVLNVLMIMIFCQENRSFDSYFGYYENAGQYGIPAGYSQLNGHGGTVTPTHGANSSPNHTWSAIHGEYDNENMDGFYTTDGSAAMGYYTRQDLPLPLQPSSSTSPKAQADRRIK